MALLPKTRLGTYEILGPLGVGGMGEVYRAKDLRLGREVAIKVLPSGVASSSDRLARFEREARTVAGLNHPNIVTLYSVEEDSGIPFLTMELVEGQTLADLVTPGGLSLARLLDLSIPLAEALVAAHERGVVHRDLKPSNVMVTIEGRVKVLDFGIAKVIGGDARDSLDTQAATTNLPLSVDGQILGTVPYMAPEQLSGQAAEMRSDLFALGIILYELATGHRPFRGTTAAEVVSSILRDSPLPLRTVRNDLPLDLERIFDRCLAKDPRGRFQTARDLHRDLCRLRREIEREAGAAPISEVPPPGPRSAPPLTATATLDGTISENVASVAVLPFVNRSANAEDEYFSDGLADELLNMLAKIRGLRVAARTSSFQFRATKEDVGTIGRRLNVTTLLEGSVRKAGSRVRVSVQLVAVESGYHLWSETYDRHLDDIFAVQDDIAHSVAKELRTRLLGEQGADDSGQLREEVAKAARGRSTDPEAHRLYLLAQHLLDRWTRENTAQAIEHLREALVLDPSFALAWAELGRAYGNEAGSGWVPVTQGYGRAREAVARALALEPDLAEGLARLAWIQMNHDWDWRGAEASFARALVVAPGKASVLLGAGALAFNLGRLDKAISLYRRALEQDPLSGASYNNLGIALLAADRFAEAEEAFRRSLELAPQRGSVRALTALSMLAQGRGAEALAEANGEPDEATRLWALAIVHHGLGRRAEADAALRAMIEKFADMMAVQIAEVHGARAELDAAFTWLERAYAQRDDGLAEIKTCPRFRSLHGDPRWSAFLDKMKLDG